MHISALVFLFSSYSGNALLPTQCPFSQRAPNEYKFEPSITHFFFVPFCNLLAFTFALFLPFTSGNISALPSSKGNFFFRYRGRIMAKIIKIACTVFMRIIQTITNKIGHNFCYISFLAVVSFVRSC